MKVTLLNQEKYKLEIKDVELPKVSHTEVLIKLKTASINHHELWSLKERNLRSSSNIIMGSDGAGIVADVGSSGKSREICDEVILNPSIN